jgi:hypothetical protein
VHVISNTKKSAVFRGRRAPNRAIFARLASRSARVYIVAARPVSRAIESRGVMSKSNRRDEELIEKLRALPPEKLAEVEDFVDFLSQRNGDEALTAAATKLSEESFRKVWDNPDDAEYDQL